jgi:hypothetical protein
VHLLLQPKQNPRQPERNPQPQEASHLRTIQLNQDPSKHNHHTPQSHQPLPQYLTHHLDNIIFEE